MAFTGKYKLINLTQNYNTIVNIDDYNKYSKYKWCIIRNKNDNVYAIRRKPKCNSNFLFLHRLIINCPDGMYVDHINHDSLDNRKSNLRICNKSQNSANMIKKKKGLSKYKGVWLEKRFKKWVSEIKCNGKKYYLGNYEKEKEAALAYNKKAKELFGKFANINEVI